MNNSKEVFKADVLRAYKHDVVDYYFLELSFNLLEHLNMDAWKTSYLVFNKKSDLLLLFSRMNYDFTILMRDIDNNEDYYAVKESFVIYGNGDDNNNKSTLLIDPCHGSYMYVIDKKNLENKMIEFVLNKG